MPGRSRMAIRYESVATIRMDPFTRDNRTPVRSGRASSWEAARTTWRTASPRAASGRWVVASVDLPDSRKLHDRVRPQFEVRPGRRNRDVVVIVGERHRSRLQPSHDVGGESGRDDTASVLDPDHLFGDLDRKVEIRSCDRKHISRAREQEAGQHRGGGGACAHGTTSGCQHVDQCISLGSELHRSLSFRPCPQSPLSEEERNVTSKGNKGCGLWMTVTRGWWMACNRVPMAVWVTAPGATVGHFTSAPRPGDGRPRYPQHDEGLSTASPAVAQAGSRPGSHLLN